MPKVSEAHRESRRDQIIDAAIACFTTQGIRMTTMAEIIEASGLSAGAIYGYFASKQELAVAAARRAIEGRVGDVAALPPTAAPWEVLGALSEGFDRYGIAPSLILQLWGEAASDPEFRVVASTAFGEFGAMFSTRFAAWAQAERGMDEAQAAHWAARLQPVLLGLGQGLIVQRALFPGFAAGAYLAGVAELLDPGETVNASAR